MSVFDISNRIPHQSFCCHLFIFRAFFTSFDNATAIRNSHFFSSSPIFLQKAALKGDALVQSSSQVKYVPSMFASLYEIERQPLSKTLIKNGSTGIHVLIRLKKKKWLNGPLIEAPSFSERNLCVMRGNSCSKGDESRICEAVALIWGKRGCWELVNTSV